jgi:predicted negative regulator of RcsB-dependent stress response
VDAQTRTALKKDDPFVHTTQLGLDWVAANRGKALRIVIALAVLIALIVVAVVIYQQRSQAATSAFGNAAGAYSTPIADPVQPLPPGMKSFHSAEERAKTANPLFADVAKRYGSTGAGHKALYFEGLTDAEMGNTAAAESTLRKASDVHDAEIASLAKLALANLLAQHGGTNEAIRLYQELIKSPTTTVPAATAQLQLAELYENTNKPADASKIYAQLKAKDQRTAAGQIAAQKLAGQH